MSTEKMNPFNSQGLDSGKNHKKSAERASYTHHDESNSSQDKDANLSLKNSEGEMPDAELRAGDSDDEGERKMETILRATERARLEMETEEMVEKCIAELAESLSNIYLNQRNVQDEFVHFFQASEEFYDGATMLFGSLTVSGSKNQGMIQRLDEVHTSLEQIRRACGKEVKNPKNLMNRKLSDTFGSNKMFELNEKKFEELNKVAATIQALQNKLVQAKTILQQAQENFLGSLVTRIPGRYTSELRKILPQNLDQPVQETHKNAFEWLNKKT